MTGFTAKLDFQSRVPLYEQLYRLIAAEIQNGRIAEDETLPSKRNLCACLGVSLSTVETAYGLLMAEGYIRSIPRSGYRVCHVAQLEVSPKPPTLPPPSSRPEGPGCQYSFSTSDVDTSVFPYASWAKITKEVVYQNPELLQRGPCQGDESLRRSLCNFLRQYRGVSATPEQIIIGAGNEYLLILLSQLLGRETGIAMEDPTYKQAYRVLGGMGHPVFPVGMDDSGFRVQELERLPASAAYVMPSHQFPMGIVMPVKRRQELLAWAMKEPDRYLIEDDYDSEFRYRGKPIPALQGMDDSGRVIYMGTFSKAIAPAIRVGYLVLPPSLMERYEERGWFYSSTVSRVDQRILAMFIGGGYFERHLNRMREIYKGKHDLLLASLKPLEKEFEISGEYAGLHVLLTCRGERTEEQLEKAAETEGIRVYGLSGSYIGKKDTESRTVILGYASLTEEKIQEGAAALAKALCP